MTGPPRSRADAQSKDAARVVERRRAADLRVALARLPSETRVGGTVTYSVAIANKGPDRAKHVLLAIRGIGTLVSVSSNRFMCSIARAYDIPPELSALCRTEVLPAHARGIIELVARPTALGTIRALARVSSDTKDPTPHDDTTSVKTAVLPPDAVRGAGSFVGGGMQFTMDAISAPRGQDPAGSFSVCCFGFPGATWQARGHVECLSVSGNSAAVGVLVDETQPPGRASAHEGFLFGFVDRGSPGAGRDTADLIGNWSPKEPCGPLVGEGEAFLLAAGDIAVTDTP